MGIRIAFMGTGRLAEPAFRALLCSTHQVAGLVTQPDRGGRGHHQHVNPLKMAALDRGVDVFQPASIKSPESIERLASWQADLFVVAAYGQMLSTSVLAIPRLGTINLHASLLPKYRGATPIHAAILNGDSETGVTIMRIEPKLDAGPILDVVRIPILPEETTGQLEARLAEAAVPVTLDVINRLAAGTMTEVTQDPALVTHVRKLSKEDGRINWSQSADQIARHVRAMQPWPGPFTELHQPNKPPLRLQVLVVEALPPLSGDTANPPSPGTPIRPEKDRLLIQTGQGTISIKTLQPDGKRPMPIADFLRGRLVTTDDRLD